MRVLIPTMGTRGDIQPYIALAQKLSESGFEPIIASHPCWRSLIEQYKIDFKPIGPDIDIEYEAAFIRGNSKNWMLGMIKTMRFMFKIIENSSLEILDLCHDVSLVIASHSHIGAAEAEASGLPYISISFMTGIIPKKLEKISALKSFLQKVVGFFINPLMVGSYNRLRKTLDLKKVRTFYDLISPSLNIIPISPLVSPPNEFWEEKNKVVGYWFTDENKAYIPSEALAHFIQDGPPPIVISLGAMSFESKEEKSKLDIFVKAINNSGMRAIIQGFNKTLQNYILPNNMISVGNIPHSWLFEHAYCVIHHGGFGTTAAALRAGVPSIIIPHVLDQFEWANTVYALGAGTLPLSCKDLSEEELTDTINSLKRDYSEISEKAKELGGKIKSEDGLAKSVELIRGMKI